MRQPLPIPIRLPSHRLTWFGARISVQRLPFLLERVGLHFHVGCRRVGNIYQKKRMNHQQTTWRVILRTWSEWAIPCQTEAHFKLGQQVMFKIIISGVLPQKGKCREPCQRCAPEGSHIHSALATYGLLTTVESKTLESSLGCSKDP